MDFSFSLCSKQKSEFIVYLCLFYRSAFIFIEVIICFYQLLLSNKCQRKIKDILENKEEIVFEHTGILNSKSMKDVFHTALKISSDRSSGKDNDLIILKLFEMVLLNTRKKRILFEKLLV